jgi:Transposase domain (DUF772)
VTGELDLSGFAAACRAGGQGQAPYDPAMMLPLVLCCYFKGIRPSRKIRNACIDDLGCVVICGGAGPGHRAVAGFTRRHRAGIRRLFVQVLSLPAAAGAVAGHLAAVGGSPVSGNASRFASLGAGRLAERIAAVQAAAEAAAAAWLDGADGADSRQPLRDDDGDDHDEDGLPGGGEGPGGEVPRRLAALAARLARLRAAQDKPAGRRAAPGAPAGRMIAARHAVGDAARRLAAAGAARATKMAEHAAAAAAGKRWAGKKPVPASANARVARIRANLATAQARLGAARRAAAASPGKVSATDPGTRLLPARNGGWLQGWNLQLTAARRQILLAAELHDNPAGAGALAAMIQAAIANCELTGPAGRIRAWLAGNGYASAASFKELDHPMLLVAVRGEAAQTGRAGAAGALPEGREKMAARLAAPAGESLHQRRAALVEPAFAQFPARFGRYLNYRGHDAAGTEIKLPGTVHNPGKLPEHRRRHPALAT